ncbi:MAG: AMP-binding protein, partial [Pseudomonadota bacterium]
MVADEKPWTAFYGPSVRADIGDPQFRTIGDFVSATADTYGDLPAFTTCLPNGMNGTLTFKQADEMSDALAVYLRDIAGLNAGDRVAVQVPNCLAYPVMAMAIFKAGCVLVNVNPLYTAEEMAKQFEDAEPSAILIADMFADKLVEALHGHPIPNVIITRVAEFMPALPKWIVGLVQKYWDQTIKPITLAHIRLPDAIAAGRAKHADLHNPVEEYRSTVAPDDIACLQYTGGTTGVSKGAMLTHANLLSNMEQT